MDGMSFGGCVAGAYSKNEVMNLSIIDIEIEGK